MTVITPNLAGLMFGAQSVPIRIHKEFSKHKAFTKYPFLTTSIQMIMRSLEVTMHDSK